ncbi:hypothetical protein KP79_PYT01623 [Mizuhopecten yessoensis]|uniref:Integrase core domain-containing protein n=1 Tax=Mizuhopecten yessoensis TaxID=6573 RepID=A0A210Q8G9_MIZYE|nr:hypothetical protein KP79_PYT01623 [Mizuhopecten yessoensis]
MISWPVYCQYVVLALCIQICLTEAVVPNYFPSSKALSRLEIIKHYFKQGFMYQDIVCLLLIRHGFVISLRQLKRILKRNNLCRRHETWTPIEEVTQVIRGELGNSGGCIGYRSMWRRLILDHGVRVKRDTVLRIMKQIDPEGVALRKAKRLRRRKYYALGPNYVWHVDGYDKLKPFGFCIHAAIDGYSRRVLWLEVSSSNNNSNLIATYYLETLNQIGCAPRLLRSDLGTENAMLSLLQPYFRYSARDSMAGMKSFMYGKSTSNQRIEAFWGLLRRQGFDWWINLFKDLRDMNAFDDCDPLHVECLKFCFMNVIQAELDRIAFHWNLHDVRSQKFAEAPHGKPDVLFFIPETLGAHDYGTKVNKDDVKLCMELYGTARIVCCQEFKELIRLLKPDVQIPVDANSALKLYFELTQILSQH